MTDKVVFNLGSFTTIMEKLTPRDIVDFQRHTGISISQALQEMGSAGDQDFQMTETQSIAFAGLVWLVTRKTDPSFTFEQAMDVPFSAVTADEGDADTVGFTPDQDTETQ